MISKLFCAILAAFTLTADAFAEFREPPLEIQITEAQAHQILHSGGRLGAMDVSLEAIVHAGARVLAWVDQLQVNVPESEREQIWRRIDRVGHEASPEAPMNYNPTIIMALYETARAQLPAGVAEILEGEGDLPAALPGDMPLADAMPALRAVHTAYSRAGRWIMLSQWQSQLDKDSRDFRPWLAMHNQWDALTGLARNWANASAETRRNTVSLAAAACPISGQRLSRCQREGNGLVTNGTPDSVLAWLTSIHGRGKQIYDAKFHIPFVHPGTRVTREGDVLHLTFFTSGIPERVLQWIADEVSEAWNTPQLQITVSPDSAPFPFMGNVTVAWEAGALPHVNAVGGGEITMDANTPLWLEHTRTVMKHEFGHVMAFPDCYTEFWDGDADAFTFYTLDPTNRMCALSGETVDLLGQELVRAYGHHAE